MRPISFHEYLKVREALLPTRPPAKGLSRINPLPITNSRRSRLKAQPVQAPNPFQPKVTPVAEVVPLAKRKLA